MDRYAVMGHPVAHSRSPRIHALFAAQTGQQLRYDAIDVPPGALAEAVRTFVAQGGRGLNITLPHKEAAAALADALTPRAAAAGAVNTLAVEDGQRLLGDNTDGVGLIRDLTGNLGWPLAGRRVLVIGAGGAARGVLPALLDAGPEALLLVNRTPERAAALAVALGAPPVLETGALGAAAGRRFDVVINATAASLTGAVPAIDPRVLGGARCYDLAYGHGPTAFQRAALASGAAAVADGLGMLVEQAAESFLLWRGVRPATAPVIARLRAEDGS